MSKLIGYRFSPTVQEVLHVIELAKAPVELQNYEWEDPEREKLKPNSPTLTFPYLEGPEGILSESKAIEQYLAEKHKPELLGKDAMEKAQVRQWIDYVSCEIYNCSREIIYPLFGWRTYCKEENDKANKRLKDYLVNINKKLEGKNFIVGDSITLADVVLFRELKFYYQLVFPKGLRENVYKNLTTWFTKLMETPEVIKVYGKFKLCGNALKAYEKPQENKDEKPQEKPGKKEKHGQKEEKEEKEEGGEEVKKPKKVNPLDLLPPSKLVLEDFKRAFLNNKDKEDAMAKFWEIYDPEGYSLWHLEYQNLPTECKVLFRTSNSKGMFLQKCDAVRRYAFAVHGVYGVEDDYKIKGLWMFRGKEVPQEMKDNDLYEYITFRKLDPSKPEDKQLVHDYWTKLNETDEVEGRKCADVEYFN